MKCALVVFVVAGMGLAGCTGTMGSSTGGTVTITRSQTAPPTNNGGSQTPQTPQTQTDFVPAPENEKNSNESQPIAVTTVTPSQTQVPPAVSNGDSPSDSGDDQPAAAQPVPLPKDIPDSDVTLTSNIGVPTAQVSGAAISASGPASSPVPSPTPQAENSPVVGLGSAQLEPAHFLDQGTKKALSEADSCRKKGKFRDGSDCYMLFQDGHFEWVTGKNKKLLSPFIDNLKKTTTATPVPATTTAPAAATDPAKTN